MKTEPSLQEFLGSPDSLAVYRNGELVFRSQASDLRPLIDLLHINVAKRDRLSLWLFDRYVGRAAALLMTLIKPNKVLAGVISQGGAKVLEEHGIEFEAGEQVEYLMGVASAGMCRWEKMSLGKLPDEFWSELQALPEMIDTDKANR